MILYVKNLKRFHIQKKSPLELTNSAKLKIQNQHLGISCILIHYNDQIKKKIKGKKIPRPTALERIKYLEKKLTKEVQD